MKRPPSNHIINAKHTHGLVHRCVSQYGVFDAADLLCAQRLQSSERTLGSDNNSARRRSASPNVMIFNSAGNVAFYQVCAVRVDGPCFSVIIFVFKSEMKTHALLHIWYLVIWCVCVCMCVCTYTHTLPSIRYVHSVSMSNGF
jgi:hypothetical protein